MAETIIVDASARKRWLWHHIMSDLRIQGGLPGVVIDPFSIEPNSCEGVTTSGTHFVLTWAPDRFMLISMSVEDQPLIEAFATVVEYSPFCKYVTSDGLITFEWDKVDPEERYAQIQKDGVENLQRL